MEKSNGHLRVIDDAEYYLREGNIFRAPLSNVIELGTGFRFGRFYGKASTVRLLVEAARRNGVRPKPQDMMLYDLLAGK